MDGVRRVLAEQPTGQVNAAVAADEVVLGDRVEAQRAVGPIHVRVLDRRTGLGIEQEERILARTGQPLGVVRDRVPRALPGDNGLDNVRIDEEE